MPIILAGALVTFYLLLLKSGLRCPEWSHKKPRLLFHAISQSLWLEQKESPRLLEGFLNYSRFPFLSIPITWSLSAPQQ
jgi:hypothetical protein